MSETAILGTVLGTATAIVLALVGVVWAMLTGRISALEVVRDALVKQNTDQEVEIGRLKEKMLAREEAHSEHRENIANRLDRMETKIDTLLRGAGRSYSPGAYRGSEGDLPPVRK